MKRVSFHPQADVEVLEAVQYYETQSVGLGFSLVSEIKQALEQLTSNPEAYQRIGRRVRRKPLWRFPYNLIYAIYLDRIRIVAFAHQKRRPYYWRKRLSEQSEQG